MEEIRNDGLPIKSHKESTPENVHIVERTMRQRIAQESLELVLFVEKRGIRLPTVPREQMYHKIIRDKTGNNPPRPHSELKDEFLH